MVLLRCDGCGGFEFKEVNGLRVCVNCGLQYDPNIIQEQVTKFANTYNINYNIQNLNAQNVYLSGNPDFEISGGTLIKYHGQSQDVVIPENVVAIGPNAFKDTYISSVKLPLGLKRIGDDAFRNTNIQEIRIPQSVSSLGKFIFGGCRINNVFVDCNIDIKNLEFGADINNLYFPSDYDLKDVMILLANCVRRGPHDYGCFISNIFIGNRELNDFVKVILYEEYPNHYKTKILLDNQVYVDNAIIIMYDDGGCTINQGQGNNDHLFSTYIEKFNIKSTIREMKREMTRFSYLVTH